MRRTLILMLTAALAAAPALAHDAGGRAMGTVESVTPERIVVRTSDGHDVTYSITADTRFTRDRKPARPDELKAGERAVVHGRRTPDGLQAMEIMLPSNPGPARAVSR